MSLISPGVLRPGPRPARRRTRPKAVTKARDHPVIVRFPAGTLPADRREVLRRYCVGDVAPRVVGVGSVGTEAFVLLLLGGGEEPVLAPCTAPGEYQHQGGHARTGRAALIFGYQGSASGFDQATAELQGAGAAKNDKDCQALVGDVATGRVQAVTGLANANPLPRLTGPLLRPS